MSARGDLAFCVPNADLAISAHRSIILSNVYDLIDGLVKVCAPSLAAFLVLTRRCNSADVHQHAARAG